ncbi:MAG: hypothetical protein ACOCRK_05475 [bacterium]
MGLDRNDYVMLAIDLSDLNINVFEEKYLPYVEGHPDVDYSLIYDYMNKDYLYFGKVLAQSDYNGFDKEIIEIDLDLLQYSEGEREEILYEVNEIFNTNFNNTDLIKLIAFTHFW